MESSHWVSINKAFSKQSIHFDQDDEANPVLQTWRKRVYHHVDQFVKPGSKILELNAGTGIDAIHFAKQGHTVHATDLSDGMVAAINKKIVTQGLSNKISVQQLSFQDIHQIKEKFDVVFSNFGGINCCDDLTKITKHLPLLLNSNALVIWVIMPRVAPWEWLWFFKGKFKMAFRRFSTQGVQAKLEGEVFTTFYYSLREIKNAFADHFEFLRSEALGAFSPPPGSERFISNFPGALKGMNRLDHWLSNVFPFNRWGDHIIVTFRFKK
ncbi:MAG TPA: hypothetical protein DGG95_04585 [Cytophagales bacterium]|jgi:SAM-dependent methyltransferase|nr:hypothetical protein [Cytophagales bacterium]